MATFIHEKKQNFLDICLTVYGNTQEFFNFAKENGKEVDENIGVLETFEFYENIGNPEIKNNYAINNISGRNPFEDSQSVNNVWQDGVNNNFTDGNNLNFTFEL